MKKLTFICAIILLVLSASTNNIPEPAHCSLCAVLPHHAPCIINLSTGELLELAVYDPHPFLVGELAEEQQSGTFSYVRGAGVGGYRLSTESITITIPIMANNLKQKRFCNSCRKRLADYEGQGYALVDLKDTKNPVVYRIDTDTQISFRCYTISVCDAKEDGKYEMTISGKANAAEPQETACPLSEVL